MANRDFETAFRIVSDERGWGPREQVDLLNKLRQVLERTEGTRQGSLIPDHSINLLREQAQEELMQELNQREDENE